MLSQKINPSTTNLPDFWEAMHLTNNLYELTGSQLNTVANFLRIQTRLQQKACHILVIGVGFGYEISQLVALGHTVSALDIAPAALKRVAPLIKVGYLANQIQTLPSNQFDLIISFLVTQHLSDADFSAQLHNCLRALTNNGIFALQYAQVVNQRKYFSLSDQIRHGQVSRSPKKFKQMVDNQGGYIVWHSVPYLIPHVMINWYAVHLTKVNTPRSHSTLTQIAAWYTSVTYYLIKQRLQRRFLANK